MKETVLINMIKCYRNSIDNKCYLPNDRVKVYSGMHFVAIYK